MNAVYSARRRSMISSYMLHPVYNVHVDSKLRDGAEYGRSVGCENGQLSHLRNLILVSAIGNSGPIGNLQAACSRSPRLSASRLQTLPSYHSISTRSAASLDGRPTIIFPTSFRPRDVSGGSKGGKGFPDDWPAMVFRCQFLCMRPERTRWIFTLLSCLSRARVRSKPLYRGLFVLDLICDSACCFQQGNVPSSTTNLIDTRLPTTTWTHHYSTNTSCIPSETNGMRTALGF
ncbi:uncharacterized protein EI90DRAFT_3082246 [Cantharellus anzutake]|uniref:uncharacterized protein n=1 Tax=Cantharellus anzutake TaxID=1750568 RepID=UPI001903562C|nr:uncharacterized protein EI90DRAFT_3082246 [Cantharellus anzutake]KAF8319503.1 hypothetical protein EI90DRAFT_3082246 [Cantharellus anzutake]